MEGSRNDLGSQKLPNAQQISRKKLQKSIPKPPKIDPKTLQSRGLEGIPLEIAFPSQIDPLILRSWGCLGASWGRLGRVLGLSWACLGAVLGPLGASWGPLGGRPGESWGARGPLGRLLGVPGLVSEVLGGRNGQEDQGHQGDQEAGG